MSLTALLTPHLTLHPPHITHQIRTLLTLLQSQQTTTNLPVHPLIASHTEIQQEWLNDDQLLNEIQATTTQWIREINETVQTERDIKSGGLKEEKEFWIEMERKVEGIEKRLAEKDVVLTMETLKAAKRFHALVSFSSDINLKETIERLQNYNVIFKDFPMDLIEATSLSSISDSIQPLFAHLSKKLKMSSYPVTRALGLVEAISRDLLSVILAHLPKQPLALPYATFTNYVEELEKIFRLWREEVSEFVNTVRSITRKRAEKYVPIALTFAHEHLEKTLKRFKVFRDTHQDFEKTTTKVGGFSEDVSEAYKMVEGISFDDPTMNEQFQFYEDRIEKVENALIEDLRNRLSTAKGTVEMIRVFYVFNKLFVRPKVRGAVQEYQNQLLDNVRSDIVSLQNRFKASFKNSETSKIFHLRDISGISAKIAWSKQLEKQLQMQMERVASVLGEDWEMYASGSQLAQTAQSFKRLLDPRPLYDMFLADITKKDLSISGYLFKIQKVAGKKELKANFDDSVIGLFKEVRGLIWMGFNVPRTIVNVAEDGKRMYPFVVGVQDALRRWKSCDQSAGDDFSRETIASLCQNAKKRIYDSVERGITIQWTSAEGFVTDFVSIVDDYVTRVNTVTEAHSEVLRLLKELETTDYTAASIELVLQQIQTTVDNLNLQGFSNVPYWCGLLNQRIELALIARLERATKDWRNMLEDTTPQADGPSFPLTVHELRITNQQIHVHPPLDITHQSLYANVNTYLDVILRQKRVQGAEYNMVNTMDRTTYASIVEKVPLPLLSECYTAIDDRMQAVRVYTHGWLQYQSLWDLEANTIKMQMGMDLDKWNNLITEIRKSRTTFDNAETTKSFGTIVIEFGNIQSKVSLKYDAWQQEFVSHFAIVLSENMQVFVRDVAKARKELEQESNLEGTISEAIPILKHIQRLDGQVPVWRDLSETLRLSERSLERQRYSFPDTWIYSEQSSGEWSSFLEIYERKKGLIASELKPLQDRVKQEHEALKGRISQVIQDWEGSKPVRGDYPPKEALDVILRSETKLDSVGEESVQLEEAKKALGVDLQMNSKLQTTNQELGELKQVWITVNGLWQSLQELRETLWNQVQPQSVRRALESLERQANELPAHTRHYAAVLYFNDRVNRLTKSCGLIADLRSDAIKDRHWRLIVKHIGITQDLSSSGTTLGTIWDLDLSRNEKQIMEVVAVAQGEMGLEIFLSNVSDCWTVYNVELVTYQNKVRLIRGWDQIFTQCTEHLNSLGAMKHSPHYKLFEDVAIQWETKLNNIKLLFDVWIDVQRQWVYLEGVFSGSADIKQLLPTETARFSTIDAEFLGLMKKVYKSPLIIDVITIPNLAKSLDRLSELLQKIQKALGDFLENERLGFPRFYFVGDEDLLDIIGNSKDVVKLQKHFRKMFAGLAAVVCNSEGNSITAMQSKEDELVALSKPVMLNQPIKKWLTDLEKEMKLTLSKALTTSLSIMEAHFLVSDLTVDNLRIWMSAIPNQVAIITVQVLWTAALERCYEDKTPVKALSAMLSKVEAILKLLADMVILDMEYLERQKCEHLITDIIHQRSVLRSLVQRGSSSITDFTWLCHMRFYYDGSRENPLERLVIKMANAELKYGFEYLGVPERIVQTALTDKCYLSLTQALLNRLGGAPFGPAGTGKTESVKALGLQLGRFVLVFCCDENFGFQAMGRIFRGLCQVGAWGCFDEFNRLEERILSAVSQQIQCIQLGLRTLAPDDKRSATIDLIGRNTQVKSDTGIFITMNPDYAGRSNLPNNLRQLFRSIAMTKPDKHSIAEVMLFSLGFKAAEVLAQKVVPFFSLCEEQLSSQPHYDFGLRALKSVLVSAGNIRKALTNDTSMDDMSEQGIVMQSIRDTIIPKLVLEDAELLKCLLSDLFPGVKTGVSDVTTLIATAQVVAKDSHLVCDEAWLNKLVQLYQIQKIHHGFMLVGPAGTGKTKVWTTLLQALQVVEGVESQSYVIDPKAMSKERLYGTLDSTTREWTDGLFTQILRKIVDNVRGESAKRHWIVFDGDVDPEWVENLNSLLDNNKLLTLPNGERLSLPDNVRIIFEVQDLKYATLATVSRCGMVWFHEGLISPDMWLYNWLEPMRHSLLPGLDDDPLSGKTGAAHAIMTQSNIADQLSVYFAAEGLISASLRYAEKEIKHVMIFSSHRALTTLSSLLNQAIRDVILYDMHHSDFPLDSDNVKRYIQQKLIVSIAWAFAGDTDPQGRLKMSNFIEQATAFTLPSPGSSLFDYKVDLKDAGLVPWSSMVPKVQLEVHHIAREVVVPTTDTVRHEDIIYSWLAEHKPLILCGPPGSGKTMTLFNALKKLPGLEVVGLNFSSSTTPELLLNTFEQHCEYRKTSSGVVMTPLGISKWLVIFCDEINLPLPDHYGTPRVLTFIRQLIERNGFWRSKDRAWVTLERIQFVAACNPPSDPGRIPIPERLLRHMPILMVSYPEQESLKQIYQTQMAALLKLAPRLLGFGNAFADAMIRVYAESQRHFTTDVQPHYIYSPRELSRWVRGIYELIQKMDITDLPDLVRIWAHEGLRLFQDRLVQDDERIWTNSLFDETVETFFPSLNPSQVLRRPILYSNWLSKHTVNVEQEVLREFVKARLKVFYEEELDVPLVLFDSVLDHALRIDRVLRQIQGHLLLIGLSGSGKTTLSKFVAWINGYSIFQINMHANYDGADFDEDLRHILRRAGCKNEKIVFIIDEGNVVDPGFLERMNTLLANAEIPGLFEGDDYNSLMAACKDMAVKDGASAESPDELYRWFTSQVAKNLHVIFTMNPPSAGSDSRVATSPALFNRCVLDWFGDWPLQALYQVASEFTHTLDLDQISYKAPDSLKMIFQTNSISPTYRMAMLDSFVYVHSKVSDLTFSLLKKNLSVNHVTPRQYIEFVNMFVSIYREKRNAVEEQQKHLNIGLAKIRDTVEAVAEMRISLQHKNKELEEKDDLANQKLQQMIVDQQEAERQESASKAVQAELAIQDSRINERKEIVMADLARAEPAVLEAQQSVSGIKKQQLTEVRSMTNPPDAVKLTMECVCTMLGNKIDGWKTIVAIIRKDDFISSIINFDTQTSMTSALQQQISREYLSNPNFNYEKVDRASKACGPLIKWIVAQVEYSSILDRVEPLRLEVSQLEQSAEKTRSEAQEMARNIDALSKRIASYKNEYAVLVSETQTIRTQLSVVNDKLVRSVALIKSLSSERQRWEQSINSFYEQLHTITGDVFLSACYITYGGYFDQHHRLKLREIIEDRLEDAGILFRKDLAIVEFLANPDQISTWHEFGLPKDVLCEENAIMITRTKRYPLIVDPSNQAIAYLKASLKEKKLIVTSFLDASYLKQVESALRFGNTILIQDAENIDPIMNSVLNKELRRTGGRTLIRLGKLDIDFAPSFSLILSTRDSNLQFRPDICSRVSFVNFTMTKHSLQLQCLYRVLQSERPDIDAKRNDLITAQGAYQYRLRQLEKSLLQILNESSGNILEDDVVLASLEKIKEEADGIIIKVNSTASVMSEVEVVTTMYKPLANACSSLYFCLEHLGSINRAYQFSLDFLYSIFNETLDITKNSNETPDSRLRLLWDDIFNRTYKCAAVSLLLSDRLLLAILLTRLKHQNEVLWSGDVYDKILDSQQLHTILNISRENQTNEAVSRLPLLQKHFKGSSLTAADLANSAWQEFYVAENAEQQVPKNQTMSESDLDEVLKIRILRPDRLIASLTRCMRNMMGASFMKLVEIDIFKIASQVRSEVPVMLISYGADSSHRVEIAAANAGKRLSVVAMGSSEGCEEAERVIDNASKTGTWVLLRNCQLASSWLKSLEQKLRALRCHAEYRLFISLEMTEQVPLSLIRMSRTIAFESASGVKNGLLANSKALSLDDTTIPMEGLRLRFLLIWLHALILERLRYSPLGWTKKYDFSDADFESGLEVINTWIRRYANGRQNIPPNQIPWQAIQILLSESVYGGRVDNEYDQFTLQATINGILHEQSYSFGYQLVSNTNCSLATPDGTSVEDYVAWINNLPDLQTPRWLGMSKNADTVLAVQEGNAIVTKLKQLRNSMEEEDLAYVQTNEQSDTGHDRVGRLYRVIPQWLTLVQEVKLELTPQSKAATPLQRFVNREIATLSDLKNDVISDLTALQQAGQGRLHTNHTRMLLQKLISDTIPKSWQRYTYPKAYSLEEWMNDLRRRMKHLQQLSQSSDLSKASWCLSSYVYPEALITATRQTVAHRLSTSLETLSLSLLYNTVSRKEGDFNMQDIRLEGAEWTSQGLIPSEMISTSLQNIILRWQVSANASSVDTLRVPLYLNSDRTRILLSAELPGQQRDLLYLQGVALIAL